MGLSRSLVGDRPSVLRPRSGTELIDHAAARRTQFLAKSILLVLIGGIVGVLPKLMYPYRIRAVLSVFETDNTWPPRPCM